jgi:hypothetical protein
MDSAKHLRMLETLLAFLLLVSLGPAGTRKWRAQIQYAVSAGFSMRRGVKLHNSAMD